MKVTQVDERDTRWEWTPREFRVMVIERTTSTSTTYNLDDCSVQEALSWSAAKCAHGETFALAIRDMDADRPYGLVWIVEPPDSRF